MPKVIADITMSLDGDVTGPGADADHGLGDAEELHAWVADQDRSTRRSSSGDRSDRCRRDGPAALRCRRRPARWNEEMGYGAQEAGTPPFFVVTHSPPDDVRLVRELGLRVTFVSDLAAAVDQARSAATDGHVVIMGGGDVVGQATEAGLVDVHVPRSHAPSAPGPIIWPVIRSPLTHPPSTAATKRAPNGPPPIWNDVPSDACKVNS